MWQCTVALLSFSAIVQVAYASNDFYFQVSDIHHKLNNTERF